MEKETVKKDRKFLGILYPDSESYDCDEALNVLDSIFDKWAYVVHDCDLKEDGSGELKKTHIHWVGKRANGVTIKNVAKKLGVPERDVEFCDIWKRSIQYLVHLNHPEKYRYNVEDIVSNIDVGKIIIPVSNEEMAKDIYHRVMQEATCSTLDLCNWCLENGLWSEFRRSYSIWKDIMHELKQERI